MLSPGGRFLIEAALPHTVIAGDRQVVVRHVDDDHVRLTLQQREVLSVATNAGGGAAGS
ncbi:hypothetical protein [Actinoplanes aureus]|uniref:Uncharacterized protein n=1 Tax=Actinoplanes aureus TaxID=2792083 RepID=A0A931CL29_9ACTN|nr:hypothetical protein [Actinoplanes aureus]MBG0569378.1 hypothetical protein [Actinoplanes aureus]